MVVQYSLLFKYTLAIRIFSLLLHSPREIVGLCGGLILVHQSLDDLAGVIHLTKTVLEHLLFAELKRKNNKTDYDIILQSLMRLFKYTSSIALLWPDFWHCRSFPTMFDLTL